MTLNANAPPFYPSMAWAPVITDDYYEQRPHSPGSEGFVIADEYWGYHEVPDEELFDSNVHPLTEEELLELEQVDEVNALLAELDIMETHQELHHKLTELTKEKRFSKDVEPEVSYSTKVKPTKAKDYVNEPRLPKKQIHCHVKKQSFVPLQQPRSVN